MFKIRIRDIEVEYIVDYRDVKYVRYELSRGVLKLILPKHFRGDVEYYIHKKDNWIYNKILEFHKSQNILRQSTKDKSIEHNSLNILKEVSKNYIKKYENLLNVRVNRVQFRSMTTKWGSCSSLGNITLSKDLRFLPNDLIEYVIYHELVHLIVLDHSDEFFNIIRKRFPDYKEYDNRLREYCFLINEDKKSF